MKSPEPAMKAHPLAKKSCLPAMMIPDIKSQKKFYRIDYYNSPKKDSIVALDGYQNKSFSFN